MDCKPEEEPKYKPPEGVFAKKRIVHVSAWTNSACLSIEGELFMWGSGVFGDYDKPKLIDLQKLLKKEEKIKVKNV